MGLNYFRVVGEGAQSPEPIEKVVHSATDALAECSRLRRICGRYGRVDVWGKDGRRITPERLQNLSSVEQEGAAQSGAEQGTAGHGGGEARASLG
jgi:hypothetical protein